MIERVIFCIISSPTFSSPVACLELVVEHDGTWDVPSCARAARAGFCVIEADEKIARRSNRPESKLGKRCCLIGGDQTSSCPDLADANAPRCARLPGFAAANDPFDGNLLDPNLRTRKMTKKDCARNDEDIHPG